MIRFANELRTDQLPNIVKECSSPIYRNFAGVDPQLFKNKRVNLEMAISRLNGVVISQGETFSLWHLVGPPTTRRGYLEGLIINKGRPASGTGGGLCQLSNAIFWLALHSDLQVIERHRHSLDIFPDDHRYIPFGTGATIIYNYKDLRLYNPTPCCFQLSFRLSNTELFSTLRTSSVSSYSYRILEIDHRFKQKPEGIFRSNVIIREKIGADNSVILREKLFRNDCRCQYDPAEVRL